MFSASWLFCIVNGLRHQKLWRDVVINPRKRNRKILSFCDSVLSESRLMHRLSQSRYCFLSFRMTFLTDSLKQFDSGCCLKWNQIERKSAAARLFAGSCLRLCFLCSTFLLWSAQGLLRCLLGRRSCCLFEIGLVLELVGLLEEYDFLLFQSTQYLHHIVQWMIPLQNLDLCFWSQMPVV